MENANASRARTSAKIKTDVAAGTDRRASVEEGGCIVLFSRTPGGLRGGGCGVSSRVTARAAPPTQEIPRFFHPWGRSWEPATSCRTPRGGGQPFRGAIPRWTRFPFPGPGVRRDPLCSPPGSAPKSLAHGGKRRRSDPDARTPFSTSGRPRGRPRRGGNLRHSWNVLAPVSAPMERRSGPAGAIRARPQERRGPPRTPVEITRLAFTRPGLASRLGLLFPRGSRRRMQAHWRSFATP